MSVRSVKFKSLKNFLTYDYYICRKLMVRTGGLILALIVLLAGAAFAGAAFAGAAFAGDSSVTVHCSEQSGMVRVVFESDSEPLIEQSTVSESYSLVKISFSEPFNYNGGTVPASVKIYKKEDSLFLNVRNLQKIKSIRLSSPPRLVIDAYVTEQKKTTPTEPSQAETKDLRGFVLMLEAGHGGSDTGIIGGQLKESLLTLSIVNDLYKQLAPKVQKVLLLRKDDVYMSFEQRLADAAQSKTEVFFSIHMTHKKHAGIFISKMPANVSSKDIKYDPTLAQSGYIERSRVLAHATGEAIKEFTNLDVVYVEAPLPMLSAIRAPAIMIELPIATPYSAETIKSIADSIVKALVSYAQR
ncbi:secreted protein containing Cell wall hydrolase/autolysin, catalytic domain protein [Candidatus Magnetobacterium bavaricum]|uniref:N-acetylmuramoyl-L-alanine amidase n=1 Tax=Candidatus Magnetobacterium bavaricum TaxID=29290 RepID=A0A0F3GMV3_9BACT|nr:secreted protein containing Cell wall hydrolase/autolysin, catalytic domain protein [Candidatus Magnetobacterium bavaricum]